MNLKLTSNPDKTNRLNGGILLRLFLVGIICMASAIAAHAQTINSNSLLITQAKFKKGDNPNWKNASFDDSAWSSHDVMTLWSGNDNKNSYGWYRIKFNMPSALFAQSDLKKIVKLVLGKIDDTDETYLNGVLIGKMGNLPSDKGGYRTAYDQTRCYYADMKKCAIKLDGENVLAIRVYNGDGGAGIYGDGITISVPDAIEAVEMSCKEKNAGKPSVCTVTCNNLIGYPQKGKLTISVYNFDEEAVTKTITKKMTLRANGSIAMDVNYDKGKHVSITSTYTDNRGKMITKAYAPKYILTPAAPATPRYNGALVYGVRPESPVIFKMAVSGKRPLKYSVANLPEGLTLDASNGVISGSIAQRGDYEMTLMAENAEGKMQQKFTIKVGDKIALTPPMGWNSWNCWGLSVSQDRVISSAKAMLEKGLADYGYNYVNIDDSWEAEKRNADGTIAVNAKFPNMAGLGKWLHENGFKFGIYSSPGDRTCGGYLGSLDHEQQDAQTYNSWGVDYLKYDWCGYNKVFEASKDKSVAAYVRPYLNMEKYLREQPRDIFYSLCQYGMADVWKWGPAVDANSWRTTGDITDTWESLHHIGFVLQPELWPYAAPGHWNDPDMLIVGKVGWSSNLRDSRLTPDEQYTHITLWSLLAANMLIGCDVAQMDDFTLNLLCNHEVNAVNQDMLGQQAKKEIADGNIQIWKRALYDGSYAVGIFNLGGNDQTVDFAEYLGKLGINGLKSVRDIWRQKDMDTHHLKYFIPSHGVQYIKIAY